MLILAAGLSATDPVLNFTILSQVGTPAIKLKAQGLNKIFTGEEMDFLDLLESFGLDMKSVAQALGIDETALNNMDKDVLLHLLTSQTANVN